jgi:hypothetical protein
MSKTVKGSSVVRLSLLIILLVVSSFVVAFVARFLTIWSVQSITGMPFTVPELEFLEGLFFVFLGILILACAGGFRTPRMRIVMRYFETYSEDEFEQQKMLGDARAALFFILTGLVLLAFYSLL